MTTEPAPCVSHWQELDGPVPYVSHWQLLRELPETQAGNMLLTARRNPGVPVVTDVPGKRVQVVWQGAGWELSETR